MSRPEFQVLLSFLAESDIEDILAYTLGNWGEVQLSRYKSVLDDGIKLLGRHPYIGRERPELSEGLRSIPAGKHLIFYRVDSNVVTILRVLHARVDITGLTLE